MQQDEIRNGDDDQKPSPQLPLSNEGDTCDPQDTLSPYAVPSSSEEEIVTAEVVAESSARPRVYVAVLVGTLVIPAAAVLSGIVLFAAALLYFGPQVFRPDPEMFGGDSGLPKWLEEFAQTRVGLFTMIVPGQLVFLAVAVGAAALSPEPFAQRLGLRRGVLPVWTWIVMIVATPLVGLGSSLLLSLMVSDVSDQLRLMTDMMQTHARSFLPGLLLLVAVVPGMVEELLFRGYLQSRLLRSWPAIGAISLSAVVFAAAHLDPIHVLGVLPLGIWLGVIAWRADSVWPAMLCHAANNVTAVLGVMYGDPHTMQITFDPVTLTTLAISGPAFLFTLLILYFAPQSAGRHESPHAA